MDPRDYEDDYYGDDFSDSEMSYNEQVYADRSDWADEQYESGDIDAEQRSEIKAGA
jgi:hypothetical protein